MPSLPSTPSRVPSGHETKSSNLYLHSLTVWPMDIVRLSGDPLIQDSHNGLPQNALGLREQASWMHTHLVSFVESSYIYISSASVAWQCLLLALTSIDGHPHIPLISRVDVRLSPFLSSPQPPFYSTYSAISMAHAHVLCER